MPVLKWTMTTQGFSQDAESLGRLGLTDDSAPDCECGKGEAATGPWAPPRARCVCGCDGLPKISDAWNNNHGSRMRVLFSPGTSQERSISSRSLALCLFEWFAAFLPFSWRRWSVSISPSALVSAKSGLTISLQSSSGARGHGDRDESSWKGTSARGAGGADTRSGHGGNGSRGGGGDGRCYNWSGLGRRRHTMRNGRSRS